MLLRSSMFLAFFIVQNSFAKSISIISHRTNFTLNIAPQHIKLKGHQMYLNLTRNKCNANLVDRFINQVNALLRSKALSKNKAKNRFLISIDGKNYYEHNRSKLGHSLLSIPREFQRIKIQEKVLCFKKEDN